MDDLNEAKRMYEANLRATINAIETVYAMHADFEAATLGDFGRAMLSELESHYSDILLHATPTEARRFADRVAPLRAKLGDWRPLEDV